MSGARVVVLGLDGATLNLVRPWAEQGHLPNLAQLLQEGASGTLRSTAPATTPLAWPSIYTGTNPGKHGLFGFQRRAPDSYQWAKSSAADVVRPAVWDFLGESAIRSGVFFVPYTFPARPLDGWLVAGRGAPRRIESRISYPDKVAGRMADTFGERALFGPRRSVGQVLADVAERLIRSIDQQTEAVCWALDQEDFEFIFTVWDHTDTAAHLFWHFNALPCPEPDSVIGRVYAAVDRGIGRVLHAAGGDPLVIVCSDHGTRPVRTGVRAHLWLQQKGLLALRSKPPQRGRSSLRSVARFVPGPVRRLVPVATRRKLNRSLQPTAEALIDWSATRIYPQPVSAEAMYLNLAGREPQGTVSETQAAEALSELTSALLAMESPEGERLVHQVLGNGDAYNGPMSVRGPDAIAEMVPGAMLAPARVGQTDTFWTPEEPDIERDPPRSVCYHDPDGMVIVSGQGVRHSDVLARDLTDITPTVMRFLDVPVPTDLDGRAIEEAFAADRLPEPRWADPIEGAGQESEALTPEEEADIDKHLRELGYIE